eukprot:m.57921 g.57921  ORF g.57921 m.57921 type:complete len:713 (+) comp7798_c0_seq1:250-2388(+)
MFWKLGLSMPNTIDKILAKSDFTLEELLNDEELLQELRSQHRKLTEYLSQADTVQKLLKYIVEGDESDDLLEKFKYPNIASEVLTSECWPIMEALSQPDALEYLWNVMDKPAPLNPLLASFFARVVQTLLEKDSEPLTNYLLSQEHQLFKLIGHLGTPAVMDVLLKMTQQEGDSQAPNLSQFWAEDQKLVNLLVGLFNVAESGASDTILCNAATFLGDLVDAGRKEAIEMQEFSTPSQFLKQLTSTDVLSELLDNVLSENSSPAALEYVLDFIASIFRETERVEEDKLPTEIDKARYEAEVSRVLAALLPRLKDFHALLLEAPEPLTTASGELRAVCGNTRLQVCTVLSVLVRHPSVDISASLVELGTIKIMLDMFKDLPHNNLFHACVSDIIEAVLSAPHDGPTGPLREHVFTDCQLLQRIMDLVAQSDEMYAKEKAHAGFYGHVLKMANAVQTESVTPDTARDPLVTYLKDDAAQVAAWRAYVQDRLLKENERMKEGLEKPVVAAEYSSGDDDGDWGNEAEAAFTRYLNDRINLTMPDDYDLGDDSDDSDEGSYGMSGGYSADFSSYNSDFPPSYGAGGGDSFMMTHPTPGGNSNGALGAGRPAGFDVNSGWGTSQGDDEQGDDPFGPPQEQSTPLDAPGGDAWAAFGNGNGSGGEGSGGGEGGEGGGGGGGSKVDVMDAETGSSEVEDSNVPKGAVDIEGGGAIFQSKA